MTLLGLEFTLKVGIGGIVGTVRGIVFALLIARSQTKKQRELFCEVKSDYNSLESDYNDLKKDIRLRTILNPQPVIGLYRGQYVENQYILSPPENAMCKEKNGNPSDNESP